MTETRPSARPHPFADFLAFRFSPKFDHSQESWRKVAAVAGNAFILLAGVGSFLLRPQYTFVAFLIGVTLSESVRYTIHERIRMYWNVHFIAKIAFGILAFASWPWIYLELPIFIGSYVAFHATRNSDGTKHYFSTPIDPTLVPWFLRVEGYVTTFFPRSGDETGEMTSEDVSD